MRYFLFIVTVTMRYFLFIVTVTMRYFLFIVTVTMNNLFLTIYRQASMNISINVGHQQNWWRWGYIRPKKMYYISR